MFGTLSRELREVGTSSLAAEQILPGSSFDNAVNVRMLAKTAVLKSIIEHGLALANHKPKQQAPPMEPGTLVDFSGNPERKDLPGWRGPAVLRGEDTSLGACIIKWQGRPLLVPMRHVCSHVGFALSCVISLDQSPSAAALKASASLPCQTLIADGTTISTSSNYDGFDTNNSISNIIQQTKQTSKHSSSQKCCLI